MITFDQENRLGHIAFLIFFLKRALVAIVFLLVAVILVLTRDSMVGGAISTSYMVGGLSVDYIYLAFSYFTAVVFLIAVIILAVGLVVSFLEYRNYSFTFEEFNLRLKRGIINKEIVSIPYRQMQNINIIRPWPYLILKISKVVIDSAGHEESGDKGVSDIILEPLDKDVAEEIRVILDRKIGVQVVADEVTADKAVQTDTI